MILIMSLIIRLIQVARLSLEKRTEGPRKAGNRLLLQDEPDDRYEQQNGQASGETGHGMRRETKKDWSKGRIRNDQQRRCRKGLFHGNGFERGTLHDQQRGTELSWTSDEV